jgi:uncharacterized protein
MARPLGEGMSSKPFWRSKSLAKMSKAEWESLCDGCGKCCVNKLEDEETGDIFQTNVACRLLDSHSCQCSNYGQRKSLVPDCIRLTPSRVAKLDWLPRTCGYVRVANGEDLPDWHHLKTGSREAMHAAGMSVRGRIISEDVAACLEDHIIDEAW